MQINSLVYKIFTMGPFMCKVQYIFFFLNWWIEVNNKRFAHFSGFNRLLNYKLQFADYTWEKSLK
jgi:hypothetical protein